MSGFWKMRVLPFMFCAVLAAPGFAEDSKTPSGRGSSTRSALDTITWRTDVATAVKHAQGEKRPLFIVSTENGNWGAERAFQHPLVMDAIETLCVPLHVAAARNNVEAAKEAFGETKTLPCIRLADASGKSIVDPLDVTEDTALSTIVTLMTSALGKAGIAIPRYLSLLEYEQRVRDSGKFERAYFAHVEDETATKRKTDRCMEVLGSTDGVIGTTWGHWLPGGVHSVQENEPGTDSLVEVEYDPETVSFEKLVEIVRDLNLDLPYLVFCYDDEEEKFVAAKALVGEKAKVLAPGEFYRATFEWTTEDYRALKKTIENAGLPGVTMGKLQKGVGEWAISYSLALHNSSYRHIPMIASQVCRINGIVRKAQDSAPVKRYTYPNDPASAMTEIGDLLSPRQIAFFDIFRNKRPPDTSAVNYNHMFECSVFGKYDLGEYWPKAARLAMDIHRAYEIRQQQTNQPESGGNRAEAKPQDPQETDDASEGRAPGTSQEYDSANVNNSSEDRHKE